MPALLSFDDNSLSYIVHQLKVLGFNAAARNFFAFMDWSGYLLASI